MKGRPRKYIRQGEQTLQQAMARHLQAAGKNLTPSRSPQLSPRAWHRLGLLEVPTHPTFRALCVTLPRLLPHTPRTPRTPPVPPLQSSEFSLCNCPRQHCVCLSVPGSALKVFNVPSSPAAARTPRGAPPGLAGSHPTLQKSTKPGKQNRRQPGLSASSASRKIRDTAPDLQSQGARGDLHNGAGGDAPSARRRKAPEGLRAWGRRSTQEAWDPCHLSIPPPLQLRDPGRARRGHRGPDTGENSREGCGVGASRENGPSSFL